MVRDALFPPRSCTSRRPRRPRHPAAEVEDRAGEGVEDAASAGIAVVENRGAVMAVDFQPLTSPALRVGQTVGTERLHEHGVARALVHQGFDNFRNHVKISEVMIGIPVKTRVFFLFCPLL